MFVFVSILIMIGTIALLVTGLIISKKYSFMGGFYFFLILLINNLYSAIGARFIGNYIDSVIISNSAPMGMTIGQFVGWLSLIPRTLEVIAISFLIVGLYRMWKSHSKRTIEFN
ncbi:hypothetical protein AB6A23_20550 [Paenibacillus tarimensis]